MKQRMPGSVQPGQVEPLGPGRDWDCHRADKVSPLHRGENQGSGRGPLRTRSLGHVLRSGIAGSHGNAVVSLLESCHTEVVVSPREAVGNEGSIC